MRRARSIMCRCRWCRNCCAPRSGSSPSCSQDARSCEQLNDELESRVAERTEALEPRPRACAERAGPQPGAGRRQHGFLGLRFRLRHAGSGTKAKAASSASTPISRRRSRRSAAPCIPKTWRSFATPSRNSRSPNSLLRARGPHRPPERRGALVRGCGGRELRCAGRMVRVSGVTTDITDRKEAEMRQALLAREVDHRARTRSPSCRRSSAWPARHDRELRAGRRGPHRRAGPDP